jgi:hypothetical protein
VILLGSLDGRKPELGLDSTFVTIRGEWSQSVGDIP